MNLQGKVYRMNSPKLKPLATGRFRRTAAVVALSGGILVGTAGAALAGTVGNNPGAVTLNPASGATSSKPTWSTTVACNPGFQGSAIFREVHADGVTTNSISPAVNGTAVPFSGTLQATMAQIQTAGGIATGGTQELVVICFSGPSLTGTSDNEMDTFVTYNADGTYSSSGTQPVPVGEIGGIALAGLAAIGLGFLQFRRIRSRRKQPVASA
jgi:hypothetical protein